MGIDYNPFSLEGKTILVTGASSGIGQTTAIECSKMGAKVIVTARNKDRLYGTLERLSGDGHSAIIADLTKSEELDNLVDMVGKVDGLVLCAGKALVAPVVYSSREKFDEVFNINFFSPVELLRLMVKKKRLHKASSVVMMISIGGTGRWTPGHAMYGTSKAALKSMVQFGAIELASKQIRVNGVCPGMVETPMIHGGNITEEQMVLDKEDYPLKRYGTPKEIALGVVYLLSDASSWMTGHSLVIDGGITSK